MDGEGERLLEKKDLEMIDEIVKEALKEINRPLWKELRKIDDKITDVRLTLENETNRNIQIIAERQLKLSGKLDDVAKIENEKELLLLRVNRLENELRQIKRKIGGMA